ncbi:MAG: hypothetical protein A4E60_02208 [Syntrophorhabdus sp. PtaB.Bin047]|jgi:O-antigen ligase|nr:MAG: hypothetical protein A4E60_02208 [Syntrophorhabdus sp. PtaB.Bin047]
MKIERRSLRVTIPVLLVFASLILFEMREFDQAIQRPIDAANFHKVMALVVVFLYLFLYLSMRGLPRRWGGFHIGYMLYILLGVASSIVYSQLRAFSFWKIFEVSCVFLLSLYVLSACQRDPSLRERFYDLCLSFLKFILIVTLAGAIVNPAEAFRVPISEESMRMYGTPVLPYQLFGVLIQVNSNSLGAMAAILFFTYTCRLATGNSNVIAWLWLLISIVFLVFSQSRTAFLGLFSAYVFTITANTVQRRGTKIVLMVLLVSFVILVTSVIGEYFTRGMHLERLAVLTGRMVWWETAIVEYLHAGPLAKTIGLGFMSANRSVLSERLDAGGAATLHSDYIDALLSTGIVGTGIVLIVMAVLLVKVYRRVRQTRSIISVEMLGVVVILCVRSLTGTTIASHNIFLVMLFSVAVYLQLPPPHSSVRQLYVRDTTGFAAPLPGGKIG